ncbi:MAG TPA: elongation factor G [Dehalococcoidia bacterium]
MKSYPTERIRNVALASHGGVGKTSLGEAMLYLTGAVSRLGRVDDGTSTSDFDPDEVKRKISINLSLLPCEWKDTKVNVIDTPGYADFLAEMKAGIRAADATVILVDATSAVETGTDYAWQFTEERGLPRLFFVTRMDRENADFAQAVADIQAAFGARCTPLQVPIGREHDFKGVVDLVTMKAYLGEKAQAADPPENVAAEAAGWREKLIEAVAESDDEVLNKYLEGEELSEEEVRRALRTAVRSGSVAPILAGSAATLAGVLPLLDALVDYVPSPAEVPPERARNGASQAEEEVPADPKGPLAALVFKTLADPYVGKLTYFRVVSGTLHSNAEVWNAARGHAERLGQLFIMRGKNQENAAEVVAGDIAAVAKLSDTHTGDTLTARDHPLQLSWIQLPAPAYSAAVSPKTKADLDKMSTALARIQEEDPALRVHRDPDTGETILSGLGESHVDVALEKMKRKFGVDVVATLPRVPYKATITVPTKAEYTHKKQTGGHGQYARVALEILPLERGKGFEFEDRIVGGVVPKQYIPAVEKGVQEAMQDGVMGHIPLVDVKAVLYDGKDHPVDSSEMAFKLAAAQALKAGVQQARPVLLEPIMHLTVRVPDAFTGDIMSDLNAKRARVQGMNPDGRFSVIEALVPLAEVQHYGANLRSLTQGKGTFSMEFSHYEEVPAHLAQKVVEQAQKE